MSSGDMDSKKDRDGSERTSPGETRFLSLLVPYLARLQSGLETYDTQYLVSRLESWSLPVLVQETTIRYYYSVRRSDQKNYTSSV